MATISWLGSSGNWNTGSLWSGAVMPGTSDVAAINALGTYTVQLNDTDAVAGVTLDAANALLQLTGDLSLNSGVFDAEAGTLVVSGTLAGGTLIPSGATFSLSGPAAALLGVTVEGTLDLSESGTSADVTGLGQSALTELKVGANTQLYFLDPEIFDGQTIAMAGGMLLTDGLDPNDGTLFFGPDTTVVQNSASTTAEIGPDTATSLFGLGKVTNEGTLIAAAGTLDLDSQGGAFDDSVLHQGPFTNVGTIEIDAGATVIDDTNSTLPGLGTILNSGGLLDLRGTLTNTNTTLDVATSGAFSGLRLDDTVIGGTIKEDGGTLAIGTGSLLAVTLLGTGVTFDTLTIGRGTEFDPGGVPFVLTASPAGYGQIYLNNGAVLANASIAYAGTQYQADLFVQGGTNPADRATPVATLAASTTLNVGAGQILRLDAGDTGTLINDAVINVAKGGRLEFDNAATYVGGGTINVAQGATVEFNGGINVVTGLEDASLTGIGLAGLTNVVGSGATLINAGSLNLEGQTLSAAGNANFSSFVNEGEVANGTFVLSPGQNQNLGQIDAGTTLSTGTNLFPVASVTMAGGVLQGAIQLDTLGDVEVDSNVTLANATGTGPGTLIIDQQPSLFIQGAATSIEIRQSATLANAVVLLSGATTATATSAFSHADAGIVVEGYQTLTLAPNTEIIETTVNGPLGALGGPGYVVNDGTIAVTAGADLMVSPYASATAQNFINNGLITIAAGGTFDAYVQTSIQSLGSIVGPGGLLRLDDAFNGTNTYVNTGNTIYVGGTTGAPNLELDNTGITGGTIVNAGGSFTAILGNLTGVTYVGPLDLTSGTDYLGNSSAAFLGFTGGTLDSQSVTLSAGSQLDLGGPENFVGATLSLGGELADAGNTLGFDANTIVNITGSVYMPVGHLLNAGTINILPGGSLNLSDSGATPGPETSEPGTIAIDDGTFTSTALNAGQTALLGPDSSLTVTSFDPGSDVVFQAPNTLTLSQGTTFSAGAEVTNFGVGDTLALTGYQDGTFASYIYGNDGVTHIADPAISFGYDGDILSVIRSSIANGGATTIAAIPVGAGYVLSGFTATPLAGLAGGLQPPLLVNEYAITYAPPGATPPSLPSISGTQANQPTTDRVAIDPFANVAITDLNTGAIDTAIVTTYGTVPSGGIHYVGTTPTGVFSNLGIGTTIDNGAGYIVSGTPAAVRTALDGLVFTPISHQTGPGQTVTTGFTIALNDQFGSVTDTTTSVLATAIDDPLLVSGATSPVYVNSNVNAAQPFHNVVLSDPDNATFTATATLASTQYLAFSASYGSTISAIGIWSTSGSLAFVQTALRGLVAYVNSVPAGPSGTAATTTMSMSINDGAADTVTSVSTIDIVSGGSIVSGGIDIIGATPGQMTSDQTPIDPVAIDIEDTNVGVTDTVTVTMSNAADGTFSDAVGGTVNGGTFTVTGIPNTATFGLVENVNSALAGLVFTPTRGQVPSGQSVTTGFTIVVNDGSHSATDASTSVIATDEGGQLAISGAQANQELSGGITVQPLSGVTIFDSTIGGTETVTVSPSNPAAGTLVAANGGTVGSNGVFQVVGGLAQAQAALQAVGFTPAAVTLGQSVSSGLTISVVDGTLNATNTTTSLDVIGTGAAGVVVNPAVAGLSSSGPALTFGTGANNFVLNLGTVQEGTVEAPITLNAFNGATAPADGLDGAFSIVDTGGFTNGGFAGFTTLAAGTAVAAGSITLVTTSAGSFSETITLTPTDVSSGGTTQVQTNQTVTVEAVVAAPVPASAVAVLNSPGTIQLPNVRVGTVDRQAVSVSNGAAAPADTLSITPVASGEATSSGTVTGLAAAGGTDATGILVGVDTSAAGLRQGSVTLTASSVNAGGTAVALASSPTIAVSADVYRLAAGTIAPISEYVHFGDSGTVALTVSNTATADGFSENLLGTLGGVTSGLTIAGAGPTGEIAAGDSDAASLRLGFSTTSAAVISATATVDLTSDGGTGPDSIDGLGTAALASEAVPVSITVDNYANPVFEDLSANGTFSGSGAAYTVNLGTIALNANPFTVNLGVLNSVSGPADFVAGTLSAVGSSAFINSGLASIGTLAAEQADVSPSITLSTGTAGTYSETIVLAGTDGNAGGYSSVLPADTLTVTGTVASMTGTITLPGTSPAVATILTPTPVSFGNFHAGASEQQVLNIENTATAGSENLDASVQSQTGAATASGVFNGISPGSTADIDVGLNTGTAGVLSGTAVLGFVSEDGTLGTSALPSQTVAVSGTAYREAAAALLPLTELVHVGDPGTAALAVANSDPSDGYSEALIAALIGTSGGLGIASAVPSADITAGTTNTTALALSFSTAQAGVVSGTATVGLTSDGGTGAGSIDGLGTTALSSLTDAVNITVNNYADPVFTSNDSLTSTGADSYVLNLGTATQGAAALAATLSLGNDASGPADWLNGTYSVSGASGFSDSGLAAFSTLAAGSSLTADSIALSTSQTGVFSETILLTPTDANSGGYSATMAQRSITVTGTIVAPTGSGTGDVHMVTYDGLHYDFQAVGDYVLTRSTLPGDSFQVQIATAAVPALHAISITTEAAAQVGSDIVTFGVGQSGVVWVDGAPDTALSAGGSAQVLSGGQLAELAPDTFRLTWSTGEALTVTDVGPYLNDDVTLPTQDGAGSVAGLLGSNSGQANDFQLPDGTVPSQPLSASELLGEFASAWQVTSATSLLGNTPMQFIYSSGGQSVLQATAAGQVLSAGVADVLSDADGIGATFKGSLVELANEVISGFSVKDVIDVSDLASGSASAVYIGTSAGGVLQLSDGAHGGRIQLAGDPGGVFQVTSDGHGGSLIALG